MMSISDTYFQLFEIRLPVRGLDSPVTVLHFSDLHIAHCNESSSPEEKERVLRQHKAWEPIRRDFALRYGDSVEDAHMIEPEEGWEHIISLANTSKADAVLFTGDMMDYFSEENLGFLAEGLERISIPWMWVAGNHELGHGDRFAPYMQGDPGFQTLEVGGIRFFGIDNADKQVTERQLAELEAADGDKVQVLVMHIPMKTPFNESKVSVFGDYFLLGTGDVQPSTEKFLSYMQREDNPFYAVLCGHVHGRHVSEYRPGHLQICASSCMVGAGNILRFVSAD